MTKTRNVAMQISLNEYLPQKGDGLVQAHIPKPLKAEWLKLIQRDGITQKDFITACIRSYVDNHGKDKK